MEFRVPHVHFIYKYIYLLNTLEVSERIDSQAPILLMGKWIIPRIN